ncbi:prolipoprotein diacylglyceryl transferase [Coprococcus eutactus]|nr:prolipoprotein diacylglyceryl transferase [Coprococcus eutactus]
METISEYFNSIIFPHLGIFLKHVGDHISIGSFEIRFYGIIIMCGFILAYFLVTNEAKRTGQDPEMYLDFILILIIPVILGARIYYILFRLDQYIVAGNVKETILGMLNIRGGGLAIYGGVIAGIITGCIFAKKRKVNVLRLADTAAFGLLIGQILGRWGNFFNREAFGAYTDSVFAMGIPLDYYRHEGTLNSLISSGVISDTMLANTQTLHGVECITVHPTFLYESLWNLMLLIFLLIYRKHQKFTGEFAFIYVAGYGLGRCIIEGLRTDSLMIGNSGIRVSQLLGFACFLVGAVVLIVGYVRRAKGQLQIVENESVQAPSEDENN